MQITNLLDNLNPAVLTELFGQAMIEAVEIAALEFLNKEVTPP